MFSILSKHNTGHYIPNMFCSSFFPPVLSYPWYFSPCYPFSLFLCSMFISNQKMFPFYCQYNHSSFSSVCLFVRMMFTAVAFPLLFLSFSNCIEDYLEWFPLSLKTLKDQINWSPHFCSPLVGGGLELILSLT